MSIIKKININGVAYDLNAQNLTDETVTIPGEKTFSIIPKFPTIPSVSDSSTHAANSAFVQAVADLKLSLSALGSGELTALQQAIDTVPTSGSTKHVTSDGVHSYVQSVAVLKLSLSALGANWLSALAEALSNAHVPSSTAALAIAASWNAALAADLGDGGKTLLATPSVDTAPASGSTNAVTSGGVYDAIHLLPAQPCLGYLAGSGNGIPYTHQDYDNVGITIDNLFTTLCVALPVINDKCAFNGFVKTATSSFTVISAMRVLEDTVSCKTYTTAAGAGIFSVVSGNTGLMDIIAKL